MKKVIYSATLALTLALTGCSEGETYTPKEIVEQVWQEKTEVKSYYGEYEMDMGDEGISHIKEWVKGEKRRIEMTGPNGEQFISIHDGEKMTALDVAANSIQIFEYLNDQSAPLTLYSPKKQAERLLGTLIDTHDLTLEEEEEIAGRKTYQLVAKANKKDDLMGDMKLWIDKENWLVLKTVSTSGGVTTKTEYTKVELEPELEDSLFVLDVPKGAVVERIDMGNYAPKEVSVEEAKAVLGSFLVFKEEDGIVLHSVEDMKVKDRPEFAFNYHLHDEPAFTLSVFESSAGATDIEEDLGATNIKIRGVDGKQLDMKSFRYIQWTESGYQYGVILENPELSFEEIYQYIERMEMVQ